MNEEVDSHRLCRVEKDVAVIQAEGKASATALVLARDLAEAHRRNTIYLAIAVAGWVIAPIIAAVLTILIRK